MPTPFLSIIMPARNEEKNISLAISSVLEAFNNLQIDGEIIVVNDGSTDRTPELIKSAVKSNPEIVRTIDHDCPKGIGASFWDGVSNARGEVVCMLPGDNENEPYEILRYLRLLDHVDMVAPFVYNKEVRTRSRNFLSGLYTAIINLTFATCFNYTNGTVLYKKSILEGIRHRCLNFFFQTDILIRLVKKGYLYAEVPYRLGSRKKGRSKAISFASLMKLAKSYFILVKDVYLKRAL
jgi:glycosyltransferase involved in cell wall biosynthesis